MQQHRSAAFTTLTFDDEHLPPTLRIRDLQLFNKRLRRNLQRQTTARTFRFFASGEYGEANGRPHYHSILFGLSANDADLIETTWGQGYARTYDATPAAIAYVAGYVAKKIGWKQHAREECVDPDTGEVYTWQPPFRLMSRRPGIGGHARQWPDSWAEYAIYNGQRTKVPRYLKDAWEQTATKQQQEEIDYRKYKYALTRDTENLQAAEKIAVAKQALRAKRRTA